jgi:hypothetical protein
MAIVPATIADILEKMVSRLSPWVAAASTLAETNT